MTRNDIIRLMASAISSAATTARSPAGAILPLAGVNLSPSEIVASAALDAIERSGCTILYGKP